MWASILPPLAARLISGLGASQSWKVSGTDVLVELQSTPLILAFWHEQQLCMSLGRPYLNRGRNIYTLISQHRDGRLIAETVKRLGIESVAGSSTRGGVSALRELAKRLKDGQDVAITPDGPKGPRHKAKPGVVALAQLSGFPVLPLGLASSHSWVFEKSWDKMFLPKPFCTIGLHFGTPLRIARNSELPHECSRIEGSLNEATKAASLLLLKKSETNRGVL